MRVCKHGEEEEEGGIVKKNMYLPGTTMTEPEKEKCWREIADS